MSRLPEIDEGARREFESAWRQGQPRPLEELLPDPREASYLPTLQELVQIDLEFRWRREPGESPPEGGCVEDYLERFPALRDRNVLRELIEEECYVRHRFGDRPPLADFRRRFGDAGSDEPRLAAVMRRAAAGRAENESSEPRRVGPYRVEKPFARGGFGVVFAAEDSTLERVVALKRLSREVSVDPEVRARFLAEARIAARLDHPGVVPVYALHDEEEGEPFYTMKLVQGQTLAEAIDDARDSDRDRPIDELERIRLLQVFHAVARTMAFVHSRGVIHRDLKPANIVVGAYGETIILDWGLAKHLGEEEAVPPGDAARGNASAANAELTQPGSMLGTPVYMSPEQAAGDLATLDQRSDVYALGNILYEICTGVHAHRGTSSDEVVDHVKRGKITPPRAIEPTVSRALEAICLKAMAPAREDRYPDAGALAADVELLLADQPVGAYRESLFERLHRWGRRHRRLLLTIAAGLLLVTIGTLIAMVQVDRQRRRAETAEGEVRRERDATASALASARGELHVANLNRADTAFRSGKLAEAARLLEQCPAEHRSWAWRQVRNRIHGGLLTFDGHTGPVADAVPSPDGEWVASAGGRGDGPAELLIFAADDGRVRHSITGHDAWIASLDVPPEGTLVLAGGGERLPAPGGRWVPAQGGTAFLVDAEEGRIVEELPDPGAYVHAVRFSPDGSTFALATTWDVLVFDTARRTLRHRTTWAGDNSRVPAIAWDPAGEHLLVIDGTPAGKLLDVRTGELDLHPDGPRPAFLPTGFELGGDLFPTLSRGEMFRGILQRDLALHPVTGGRPKILAGHERSLTAAEFSPAGRLVAAAARDGSVRVFDLFTDRTSELVHAHDEGDTFLRYDRDGELLVTAGADGKVRLFDPEAPQGRRRLVPIPGSGAVGAAFDPEGERLVDSELRIFDCRTGALERDLNELRERPVFSRHLDWSPDGAAIVVVRESQDVGETASLLVFDAASGILVRDLDSGMEGITAAGHLPDGRFLVGGRDGSIRSFELGGDEPPRELIRIERLVRFTPTPAGDSLIAVADDGSVHLVDVGEGTIRRTWERAHAAGAGSVAVSSDGRLFATGAADGEVHLWELASGELRATFTAHTRHVIGLGFSPDGERLVSVSLDHTARVHDTRSPREVFAFPVGENPESGIACAVLGPDGGFLAVGSESVLLYDAR